MSNDAFLDMVGEKEIVKAFFDLCQDPLTKEELESIVITNSEITIGTPSFVGLVPIRT